MFRIRPGAPVSRIKLPSVVSARARIKIKLPARLKGITKSQVSVCTTGSRQKFCSEDSLPDSLLYESTALVLSDFPLFWATPVIEPRTKAMTTNSFNGKSGGIKLNTKQK